MRVIFTNALLLLEPLAVKRYNYWELSAIGQNDTFENPANFSRVINIYEVDNTATIEHSRVVNVYNRGSGAV